MKLSRFRAIHNGLNGTAKKVYDAVPINSHWSQFKIMRELERVGKQLDLKTIQGCLGYMLSVGIIEQNAEKDFIRVPITMKASVEPEEIPVMSIPTKEETAMATTPDTTANPVMAPGPKPATVFDVLAKLVERSQSIIDQVEDLKDDIEKAAFMAQTEAENNVRDLAKLHQLKALLTGL